MPLKTQFINLVVDKTELDKTIAGTETITDKSKMFLTSVREETTMSSITISSNREVGVINPTNAKTTEATINNSLKESTLTLMVTIDLPNSSNSLRPLATRLERTMKDSSLKQTKVAEVPIISWQACSANSTRFQTLDKASWSSLNFRAQTDSKT